MGCSWGWGGGMLWDPHVGTAQPSALLPPKDAPTASVLCAAAVEMPMPRENLGHGLILPRTRGWMLLGLPPREGCDGRAHAKGHSHGDPRGHGFDGPPPSRGEQQRGDPSPSLREGIQGSRLGKAAN